jgi:hypothetical protein
LSAIGPLQAQHPTFAEAISAIVPLLGGAAGIIGKSSAFHQPNVILPPSGSG